MKSPFLIPLAVATTLTTIVSAAAVPAQPIDPTSVTLLPAEGTPEPLRKMVAAFARKITDINNEANAKREQLRTQMTIGFERAISAAQSAGEIETILALKNAKEQFDSMETSDIPMVKNALVFRDKKTAEIETARLAAAMKSAKELNDQLDKAKKDETTKGNFESAKTISGYQKKLAAWAQSIRGSNSTIQTEQPKPVATLRPQSTQPLRKTSETKTVSVRAVNADGESIGFANPGDVFKIRYISGKWCAKYIKENPDAQKITWRDHRCILIQKDNPSRRLAVIPANTKQTPFSFEVEEEGEYALRIWDGMDEWNRGFFNDNSGTIQYEVTIVRQSARP